MHECHFTIALFVQGYFITIYKSFFQASQVIGQRL